MMIHHLQLHCIVNCFLKPFCWENQRKKKLDWLQNSWFIVHKLYPGLVILQNILLKQKCFILIYWNFCKMFHLLRERCWQFLECTNRILAILAILGDINWDSHQTPYFCGSYNTFVIPWTLMYNVGTRSRSFLKFLRSPSDFMSHTSPLIKIYGSFYDWNVIRLAELGTCDRCSIDLR